VFDGIGESTVGVLRSSMGKSVIEREGGNNGSKTLGYGWSVELRHDSVDRWNPGGFSGSR
jgi:hypothetical protein